MKKNGELDGKCKKIVDNCTDVGPLAPFLVENLGHDSRIVSYIKHSEEILQL